MNGVPIFADYRLPAASVEAAGGRAEAARKVEIDGSLLGLVTHWRLVIAELIDRTGIDLYDPAVRARPWPGVRTAIFSLLDSDTRLRHVLTRR